MAVSRKAMTEGIRTPIILCALIDAALQSLSQKSEIFASSLYTREPGVLPHQCFIHRFSDTWRSLHLVGTMPSSYRCICHRHTKTGR